MEAASCIESQLFPCGQHQSLKRSGTKAQCYGCPGSSDLSASLRNGARSCRVLTSAFTDISFWKSLASFSKTLIQVILGGRNFFLVLFLSCSSQILYQETETQVLSAHELVLRAAHVSRHKLLTFTHSQLGWCRGQTCWLGAIQASPPSFIPTQQEPYKIMPWAQANSRELKGCVQLRSSHMATAPHRSTT